MGFKLPKSSFLFKSPNKRADIGVIPVFDDTGKNVIERSDDYRMTEKHKQDAKSKANIDEVTDENRIPVIKQLMRDKNVADRNYARFTETNMYELDEKNEDGTYKHPDLHLELAEINKGRTNVQLTDKDAIAWMNYQKYRDEQAARQIEDKTERFEEINKIKQLHSMDLDYFREHGHINATGE